jgi:hypothetical protein
VSLSKRELAELEAAGGQIISDPAWARLYAALARRIGRRAAARWGTPTYSMGGGRRGR